VIDLDPFLEFAIDAAWKAGQRTLAHFQVGVDVERKSDQSPVTIADRSAEQVLRDLIAGAYPDHAILGEEFGEDTRRSAYRWVIDPIDGTQSFIRGVPLYGVLVALEIDGTAHVGVAHFPGLGETVAAARDRGCWWNGRRARVSAIARLEDAAIGYSDTGMTTARLGVDWGGLLTATRVQRGWGDCYGHCLVATGRLDVMLDPAMHPWDCAALMPILEEAGGRFTDWKGVARIDGGDAFSTNGSLHERVLAYLKHAPVGRG
jgi:histidinol phosphatase-like enzyme (inositol monophosphatase family)